MLRQLKRPFWDIVFDALRATTTTIFGQTPGGVRRFPQPIDPISSDPVVIKAGEELVWDRRNLPQKQYVSVKCDDCDGRTYRFTILRDHGAFRAEREGLGSCFTALKSTLRVATGWNRICLSGKCISCGKEIEGYIDFDHQVGGHHDD